MKKLLLSVLSLLFMVSAAVGQENYQQGYVVTLKGDTIHGFINYRNWGINPDHIEFKNIQNGAKTVYRPLEIKAFFVHGESYLGAIIKSETSSRTHLSFMSDSARVETKTDTTFLRVLASGHPGLLFYENDLNIKNFYLMKDGKINLLEYKKYIAQGNQNNFNANNYLEENKKYVGQLMVYLNACPKIRSQISLAEYNSQSLIKLFKNYYKCRNENVAQVATIEKTKIKFGIVAGLLSSKVMISGSNLAASRANIHATSGFTGGIILDLIMPRNLHEWSLHNELTYNSFVATGSSSVGSLKFGYSSILLTDLARFTHSFGKFSGFVNAGVSNGIILKYTNNIAGSSSNTFPPNGLRKRVLAWVVGAGLGYKKVTFEVRGDWVNQLSSYTYEGAVVNQLSFLVGYTF